MAASTAVLDAPRDQQPSPERRPGAAPAPAVALPSPFELVQRSAALARRWAGIAAGASAIDPGGDRRFAHPAWRANPFFRGMAQNYLAWSQQAYAAIDELGLDEAEALRARFATALAVEAAAPTNTLAGNPEAIEATLRSGGRNLVDGYRNLVRDAQHNGGMPSMVDTGPFELGETVAATPGDVVFRNEVLELIQYRPTTPETFERPLFVVPPQINKFYVLDLAPGRSLVEHAVAQGQQVFR